MLMEPNERIGLIRKYELWLLNDVTGMDEQNLLRNLQLKAIFLIAVERHYRTLVLPSLCYIF